MNKYFLNLNYFRKYVFYLCKMGVWQLSGRIKSSWSGLKNIKYWNPETKYEKSPPFIEENIGNERSKLKTKTRKRILAFSLWIWVLNEEFTASKELNKKWEINKNFKFPNQKVNLQTPLPFGKYLHLGADILKRLQLLTKTEQPHGSSYTVK